MSFIRDENLIRGGFIMKMQRKLTRDEVNAYKGAAGQIKRLMNDSTLEQVLENLQNLVEGNWSPDEKKMPSLEERVSNLEKQFTETMRAGFIDIAAPFPSELSVQENIANFIVELLRNRKSIHQIQDDVQATMTHTEALLSPICYIRELAEKERW
jgi:hypothetical protein